MPPATAGISYDGRPWSAWKEPEAPRPKSPLAISLPPTWRESTAPPVAGSIVDALKRLEYRGYDSAVVATLEGGKLVRRRAEGKLRNLEAKLAAEPLSGSIGIGHTRWATRGKPTEANAHPHASRRLAVVHNSIIENFKALREELAAKGRRFETETDSEIAAFMVEDELASGKSPAEAVHAALKRMRGTFALVYPPPPASGASRPAHSGGTTTSESRSKGLGVLAIKWVATCA